MHASEVQQACSSVTASGTRMQSPAGTTKIELCGVLVATRSPTAMPSTPGPTSTTREVML